MKSILTVHRPCLCFMRRRPIQKMMKSPWTLVFGVSFNLITILLYYIWLNESGAITWPSIHTVLYWSSLVLLLVSVPLFIATASLNPGYMESFFDYTKLVETALEIGLHLDNFCSYCETIKSETSFHCTICNKCVEHFDHHCPFINNCLGYRNHKYFLAFIFLYSFCLMLLLTETLRHFVEIYKEIGQDFYADSLCMINIILILLHIPVFLFQWHSQCSTLCKRPDLPPQFIDGNNNVDDEPTQKSLSVDDLRNRSRSHNTNTKSEQDLKIRHPSLVTAKMVVPYKSGSFAHTPLTTPFDHSASFSRSSISSPKKI